MQQQHLHPSVRFFVSIIGIVTIALMLKEMQYILLPFFIAYIFYFLFAPLNQYLKRFKIPLGVSVPLNLALVIVIMYSAFRFIVLSVIRFSENSGVYAERLNSLVQNFAKSVGSSDPELLSFSIEELLAKLDYTSLAGGVISSSLDFMGSVLLVLFFYIFIVGGHQGIYTAFRNRFVSVRKEKEIEGIETGSETEPIPVKIRLEQDVQDYAKVDSTFKAIPEQIQNYLLTKIAVNISAGIGVWIVLMILGVPFSEIWGAFCAILNFIPSIGSALALILPVLITLLESGSIGYALFIAAVMAVLQTIFFNIMEPMMLGKRLNLNPIVILLSVLIWGYIWGITGMLMAVPITAVLKIVLSNIDGPNARFISELMSGN